MHDRYYRLQGVHGKFPGSPAARLHPGEYFVYHIAIVSGQIRVGSDQFRGDQWY